MNSMHLVPLLGILAFAVGSSLVPILRALILHTGESHKTISDGLTGPWHWFEAAGFIALSASLIYLGIYMASATSLLCWTVAGGVFGAMATDTLRTQVEDWLGWTPAQSEKAHITCAAIAFVTALFMEAALTYWHAHHHLILLWSLVAAYPVLTIGTYLMWPKYTAWQEKVAAACIVTYIVAWSLLA